MKSVFVVFNNDSPELAYFDGSAAEHEAKARQAAARERKRPGDVISGEYWHVHEIALASVDGPRGLVRNAIQMLDLAESESRNGSERTSGIPMDDGIYLLTVEVDAIRTLLTAAIGQPSIAPKSMTALDALLDQFQRASARVVSEGDSNLSHTVALRDIAREALRSCYHETLRRLEEKPT